MTSKGRAIRVAIVDDEALARDGIRLRLTQAGGFEIAGEYESAGAALEQIESLDADVWFLDVRMPGLSGFDLLAATAAPLVVFVTAFGDHALDAFRSRALDYVLKPFDDQRFGETIARIRSRVSAERDGSLGRVVRAALSGGGTEREVAPGPAERLAVPTARGTGFVRCDAIDWVEARRDLVRIHAGPATYLIRETLTELHGRLDGRRFVRVHRSTVVNIERIVELQPFSHGESIAVLVTGQRIRVSRTRGEALHTAMKLPRVTAAKGT